MQQFSPFKIVHVEGRNNECADSLSRLHLHNLMEPKHDCLSDEEARLAEEGEGGRDEALMNCTTFRELVDSVNHHHHFHARCNHHSFARCDLIKGKGDRVSGEGALCIAPVSQSRAPTVTKRPSPPSPSRSNS